MSQYGFKINNYEAGSIYDVNLGVREFYDTTPAMLTNSLFLDFLKDNGLRVTKNDFTRDVICVNFSYGSTSYDLEKGRLKKISQQNRVDRKKAKGSGIQSQIEKTTKTKQWIERRYQQVDENKDKYKRISRKKLREHFYINGIDIKYPKFGKDKKVNGYDVVHYKMLYRTPGKAKAGKCMFIREELYDKAHDFLWMGLEIPEKNAPIVEIGAYSSLVTSTIEGRIHIPPEQVLVVKDVDSFFTTNVLSVETDENKQCYVKHIDNYKVKNVLFDGQALIDESIFPSWGNGYVLLRQHFFKAAAFCTRIQQYFKDYFGDKYETATVTDMWGNKHLAKEVKMITTENAIKWVKFDVAYEYWCQKVWDNGAYFGIVKTAHESKYGSKQRMSYQMVNALDINTIEDVLSPTKDYIYQLKTDDGVYFDFLRRTSNFSNDNDVLLALCEQDPEFVKCDYFVERRNRKIAAYVADVKQGHILQNGDNLVIVGNPYGMLMHAVGEDALKDPTFEHEDGCIQCWTARFDDGEYLAEFRSPFNSRNSLGYMHNKYHTYWDKYFNFGKQILAVNMIGTDVQDLNNGSDQDSDSFYVTNQIEIVEHAKHCYNNYKTIVNNIPKEKNVYDNTLKDFSIVDNKLSAAQLDIGESSNVAQIGLSYTYNDFGRSFEDHVAILAVLAQCAIDNAKRSFDVDIHSEIQRIKQEMNIKSLGYPAFFAGVNPSKRSKVNPNIVCPMNSVYAMKNKQLSNRDIIDIKEFFINHTNETPRKTSKKVEAFIEAFIKELMIYDMNKEHNNDEYLLLRSDYDDLIHALRGITLSKNYVGLMSWLINRAFAITPSIKQNREQLQTRLSQNRAILLKTLYDLNPKCLLQCFKKGNT